MATSSMATENNPPPAVLSLSLPSKVSLEAAKQAVYDLLQWKDAKSKTEKPQLLSDDDYIYLYLTLKKIPPKGRTNPYKIPLPHSLHSNDFELCLIVDDRPKSTLTKEAIKKKIQSENIAVSKILRLTKLKSDYRPFEAKRKLCDSYELFLTDKRVVPLLPKLLGKHFYKKKKIPVPVDLSHKNWKEQIDRACGSALFYLRQGACSVIRIGKSSMDNGEIAENVIAAINGVVEFVPKKWMGVRSFHLKFAESVALPLYQVLPDMKLKIQGVKENEEDVKEIEDEIKGSAGKKNDKVAKKKGSKKGRIHEVRYMDNNIDDLLDGDELGSDVDEDINKGEKKENVVLAGVGSEGKKRKKEDLAKEQNFDELNSDKPSKKAAKVKKGGDVKQNKDGLSVNDGGESGGEEKKKSGFRNEVKDGEAGAGSEGKKRKKEDLAKEQNFNELNSDKPSKKAAKVKKGGDVKPNKDGLSVKDGGESGGEEKKKSGLRNEVKDGEVSAGKEEKKSGAGKLKTAVKDREESSGKEEKKKSGLRKLKNGVKVEESGGKEVKESGARKLKNGVKNGEESSGKEEKKKSGLRKLKNGVKDGEESGGKKNSGLGKLKDGEMKKKRKTQAAE